MFIFFLFSFLFLLIKKLLILFITVAVTEGLVREEQLLHDMSLLGAMTMEITQMLTRAGYIFTNF
jgi:hypothetical protein